MSLGGSTNLDTVSIPPSMVAFEVATAQRLTVLEGRKIECINPPTLKTTRLARVQSAFVQTLMYNLVRNARQSANGDHKLATVLISKWLAHTFGTRLGKRIFQMAFPEESSPVNLSLDGIHRTKTPHKPPARGRDTDSASRISHLSPSYTFAYYTRISEGEPDE